MTLQNIDQLLKRAGKLTPSERLLLATPAVKTTIALFSAKEEGSLI